MAIWGGTRKQAEEGSPPHPSAQSYQQDPQHRLYQVPRIGVVLQGDTIWLDLRREERADWVVGTGHPVKPMAQTQKLRLRKWTLFLFSNHKGLLSLAFAQARSKLFGEHFLF